MQLLLDTHTLIWYNENDVSLSAFAFSLIGDSENDIFVSVSSLYEIAIKVNIGKLKLGKTLKFFYQQTIANNISVLQYRLITYLNT